MPVTTPHATGAHHPVLPRPPKGLQGSAPAKTTSKPPVEPVAAQNAKPSSPPVESNASNLRCSEADAGLSQPAAPGARGRTAHREARAPGGRSGSPKELLARYREENPEEESIYKNVSLDFSLPAGQSWDDVRLQLLDKPEPPAEPAEASPPPTSGKQAHQDSPRATGPTPQDASSTKTEAPPSSSTGNTHANVDFDLENDPDLKRELLALNAKYAPPEAKAPSAPLGPQVWKAGVFARKRSASLEDVPRPTPAATGKDASAKKAPSEEGGLKRLFKRLTEPRIHRPKK